MNKKIAFIGAGKMVSAIVRSLLRSGSFDKKNISCCSANDGTSETLSKETGIVRHPTTEELLSENPNLLVLGCKPQQLDDLPESIGLLATEVLILSIMAGSTLTRLKEKFPFSPNIVRSMPNTPGQIGAGITGYLFSQKPAPEHQELIHNVLAALGKVKEVNREADIDSVTAISGSGPAYVFEFTCALENAAKQIGLAPPLAKELAIQTVIGAAKLMENSNSEPEELRKQVTSPNGTTYAALESLSKDQFRDIIQRAVLAAKERSTQLSNE